VAGGEVAGEASPELRRLRVLVEGLADLGRGQAVDEDARCHGIG